MNLLSHALNHIAASLPDGVQWVARKNIISDAAREVDKMVEPMDDDVRAFHIQFGHAAPGVPTLPPSAVMNFRIKLIQEECAELCYAIERRNLPEIAAEACDLIWVVIGTMVVCGLRLDPLWRAVRIANMNKVPNPDGGKPLKPEGWQKPDCETVIGKWRDQEVKP